MGVAPRPKDDPVSVHTATDPLKGALILHIAAADPRVGVVDKVVVRLQQSEDEIIFLLRRAKRDCVYFLMEQGGGERAKELRNILV